MALVSMKKVKPFTSEDSGQPSLLSSEEKDDYPYGLRIDLEDEELQKLGNIPLAPGQEVLVKGIARVVSVSQEPGDESERRVGLQIVALQLGPDPEVATADRLYNLGEVVKP